jgi:hypothetical protein
MAEPAREQVLSTLVTKLQGMTGVRVWGTPYPNEIRVERKAKSVKDMTQFPHLCVLEGSLDGPGSTAVIEVTVGNQVGLRHELQVLLAGYVKAAGDVEASTWRQRLWHDCLRTLMAENTLSGLVMKIEWVPELETNEATLEAVAEFVQPLQITFHETFTTD